MKKLDRILAVVDFLGSNISDEQVEKLMDDARGLSISDKEILLRSVRGKFYTEMSMNDAEMGGYGRY